MKIVRAVYIDREVGEMGVEITIQSLDGTTHSKLSENEGIVGKMLDGVRAAVRQGLVELAETDEA